LQADGGVVEIGLHRLGAVRPHPWRLAERQSHPGGTLALVHGGQV
jgi:hypothetical protein